MNLLDLNDYMIRRRFLTILGKYDIYNSDGASIGYCKHKAFKTKDILADASFALKSGFTYYTIDESSLCVLEQSIFR